jgi:ABC-type dipeptide/oligopeptide/nickel transport system ATPase component
MASKYECRIPRPGASDLKLTLEGGSSIFFVGANGSGKTRLGVHIENKIPDEAVQRIAAQKSLAINDTINLISLERATNSLRFGYADLKLDPLGSRLHQRWGTAPATHLLSDFDALLQTLFAEHHHIASKHLQDRKTTPMIPVPTTQLEHLKEIWDGLLRHRALQILDSSIKVLPKGSAGVYPESEMSDGERSIFYFLGQCLVAPANSVIIIDEPEGHIHKAILGPLWDAIEGARPDCSFIYITHDLDFAATRTASAKYFLKAYNHQPERWDIEELPEDTGLSENVVAELVGSRKPILFVEGVRGSLDLTIYRSQYPEFTVVPMGSCEAVIHSVASYRASAALHRLGVCGLVDADDRDGAEVAYLRTQNVEVLPVAEVENLLLLPDVFLALAKALACSNPIQQLAKLKQDVISDATTNLDLTSARFTTRCLDRRLKRVSMDAKDIATLCATYQAEIASIDPKAVFQAFRNKLDQRIQAAELPGILQLYDNKGLLARVAAHLGLKGPPRKGPNSRASNAKSN